MHSSPVRHSPPVRASSYCAAVRLACVRPTASVHSEPGSNSSLKTTCPKANAFSCRSPTWQRIACFKTIDSLLDQNVCKMDSHPSCRRPHKIPAHTFKELRNRPQRLLPSARRFRRSEPPIIAGFSASSTPFSRPSHRSGRCWRCRPNQPGGFPSKRAAYYGRLFCPVNPS